ncbi:MAG TPA: efflux RND transporter periplasmic adaptor subunit [Thermoanaerobaculia bacterium]|jgi:HlyD family secretion protein|nr:efflux RND transporter periplasmic adaptor subunit [Thermoanaerobaculia bacterium]
MRPRFTALVLVFALLACKGGGDKDAQYKTEKIDRGNVTMTVTATGTMSAVTTVQIGSQVSGVIARLYADFNSQVQKGQLLAEIDPTPFQQLVEQRRADVTRAQVQTDDARIKYDRQKRLLDAGLTAQAEVDAAKAVLDGARAQVQQATAALSSAQTNLRYTKITSPTDGIVVDKQYEVGQTVAASFQAPTLFQIAQDLTKMQVQADVDQSDIGRVKVGQIARFNVDAYPDEEFRGRISQIRYNAQVNQNVVTYPVILEVENPEGRLRPKMTANVTIDVDTVRDVMRVPNAALRFKPPQQEGDDKGSKASGGTGGDASQRMARSGQGGGPAGAASQLPRGRRGATAAKTQTVYLLGAEKKLTPVEIRTGITDGRFTQVVSGTLKEGDTVIVGLATAKVEGPPPMGGQGGPGGGPRTGGGRRG